jgi:hypothetical protein
MRADCKFAGGKARRETGLRDGRSAGTALSRVSETTEDTSSVAAKDRAATAGDRHAHMMLLDGGVDDGDDLQQLWGLVGAQVGEAGDDDRVLVRAGAEVGRVLPSTASAFPKQGATLGAGRSAGGGSTGAAGPSRGLSEG